MLAQRVYAEVNLDAICQNVQNVMQKVGQSTKVMAIIKAGAYGHGAIPVAKALQEIGVFAFGVATAKEALALRRAGIQNGILILGPVFSEDLPRLLENNVSMTISCLDMAKEVEEVAALHHKNAKIHIKVDTGMGRIGLAANASSLNELRQILALSHIEAEGIFTHFACADEKDLTSCLHQKDLFLKFIKAAEEKGMHFSLHHMCNSAAIMEFKDDFLDMVRCGITTYGLYPSDEVQKENLALTPAMQLKSHISFLKTVPEGFAVSYGSTYITQKETKIATIPVGYADGYPRALSSKGEVLIRGQRAKIIGRICMDQCMVDVTDIPNVQRLDEVTLIGTDGKEHISIEEIAEVSGGFHYELLCGISSRVPRVYIQGGEVVSVLDALD